jgi:hypothetical protein
MTSINFALILMRRPKTILPVDGSAVVPASVGPVVTGAPLGPVVTGASLGPDVKTSF